MYPSFPPPAGGGATTSAGSAVAWMGSAGRDVKHAQQYGAALVRRM
jgi:hypothetical protein